MLRNSAMVLGSGTPPESGPIEVVVTWACKVVWPLFTELGTSHSWLFDRSRLPVPLPIEKEAVVMGSKVTSTLDWLLLVTVPLRLPLIRIGLSDTAVPSNELGISDR